MRKVKIIKSTIYVDTYDDYYTRNVLYPAAGDWQEVDDAEYEEIRMAVQHANKNKKNHDGVYVLVEYSDEISTEVFTSARNFKEKILRQKAREEKKKAEAKAKREATARDRKKKQLEKLKAELGED